MPDGPKPVAEAFFRALLVRLDALEQRFLELRTRHTTEKETLASDISRLRADLERGHE